MLRIWEEVIREGKEAVGHFASGRDLYALEGSSKGSGGRTLCHLWSRCGGFQTFVLGMCGGAKESNRQNQGTVVRLRTEGRKAEVFMDLGIGPKGLDDRGQKCTNEGC